MHILFQIPHISLDCWKKLRVLNMYEVIVCRIWEDDCRYDDCACDNGDCVCGGE